MQNNFNGFRFIYINKYIRKTFGNLNICQKYKYILLLYNIQPYLNFLLFSIIFSIQNIFHLLHKSPIELGMGLNLHQASICSPLYTELGPVSHPHTLSSILSLSLSLTLTLTRPTRTFSTSKYFVSCAKFKMTEILIDLFLCVALILDR